MKTKTAAEALEEALKFCRTGETNYENAVSDARGTERERFYRGCLSIYEEVADMLDGKLLELRAHSPATEEEREPSGAPEKIYLQTGDGEDFTEDHPLEFDSEGVTWCSEQQYDSDIPYIRADLAHPPAAEEGHAPTYTYASDQATNCAVCGVHKHTPLRVDSIGGYVCLTCIDQQLARNSAQQPAQGEERERFEAWLETTPDKLNFYEIRLAAYMAGAALTPRIGEAVAWMNAEGDTTSPKNKANWQLDSFNMPLYLHPAQPAEQEGDKARLEDFRDAVLNQRGALAENGMSADQINDVLTEFDNRFINATPKG